PLDVRHGAELAAARRVVLRDHDVGEPGQKPPLAVREHRIRVVTARGQLREDHGATHHAEQLPASQTHASHDTIGAMFATTFLGHQGWLFRTDKAAILVDPLLCEDFGGIHALDY